MNISASFAILIVFATILTPAPAFAILQDEPLTCKQLAASARSRCLQAENAKVKTGAPQTINDKLKVIMERRQMRRSDTSDHTLKTKVSAEKERKENKEKLKSRRQKTLDEFSARAKERKRRELDLQNVKQKELRTRLDLLGRQEVLEKSDVRKQLVELHDQIQKRRDDRQKAQEKCRALTVDLRRECLHSLQKNLQER